MNLNATQTRLLAVVDRHLDGLLDRVHIVHPAASDRDVLEQWQSLIYRLYSQHPNTYLHVILRRLHPTMDEAEVLHALAQRLRSFREWVAMSY